VEALAAYDQAMKRFGDAGEPAIRDHVTRAARARAALGGGGRRRWAAAVGGAEGSDPAVGPPACDA
jgi:hypothetical protein